MKRTYWISGTALLVLVGLAAGFHLVSSRRHYQAAELLPPETLLFLDLPSVEGSRQRFAGTALGKIWAEPEIQTFLAQPLQIIHKNLQQKSEFDAVAQSFLRLLGTAKREAFIACTDVFISPSLDAAVVLGFDPGDQDRQAGRALDQLVTQCRIDHPEVAIEEHPFESVTYRVWSPSKKIKIAFARVGNFYLFSRGEEPLQQVILRAQGKRKDLLSEAPSFAAHRAQGSGGDALMFLNPQPLFERLKLLAVFQPSLRGQLDSLLPFQSLFAASTFKEGGIEDHWWTTGADPHKGSSGVSVFQKCERHSLKAAGANTMIYGAIQVDLVKWYQRLKTNLGENGAMLDEAVGKAMGASPTKGLPLDEDLLPLIGPELAFLLEWNESNGISPSLVLQIRDAAKVQTSMEKLFATLEPQWLEALKKEGLSAPPQGNTAENIRANDPSKSSIHSLKSPGSQGSLHSPSFAVTDSWLIVSASAPSVERILQTLAGKSPTLAARPEFQIASSRFTKEGYLFIYGDPRRLFEPIYKLMDWAVSFANQKDPGNGKYVNPSKIPQCETVARHLFPSVYVQESASNGVHLSSFGPISLSGLTFGGLGAAVSQAEKETLAQ